MLLADGSLVVQGRMDREIKIRGASQLLASIARYGARERSLTSTQGYRIAPEEVETAIIAADDAVHGASVQVSLDGLSLVAIVTPETCRAEMVQSGIIKTLPSHMRPSTIFPVPSLPLNVSGKIDHNKIRENLGYYMRLAPKMAEKSLGSYKVHRDSGNHTERYRDKENFIAKAWQEEIGLSEIPNNDVNFFDIGGHR